MKSLNNITKAILILFCIQNFKSFAQSIGGNDWILPNTQVIFTSNTPSNAINFSWSASCVNVSFSSQYASSTSLSIPKSSLCNIPFTLMLDYDLQTIVNGSTMITAQPQKTLAIKVLPYLKAFFNSTATSLIYPGESVTVKALNLLNGYYPCASNGGFPLNTLWNATGGSMPAVQSWTNAVLCNSINLTPIVNVGLNFNCPLVGANLESLDLTVALRTPTWVNCPTQLGCGYSYPSQNVVYSVSQVIGANYYVWTYPTTLLSPINTSSVNGQSIIFDAIQVGSGIISVTAYNSNGSSIFSGPLISQNINICCTSIPLNINATVTSNNSPYRIQSGATINSTNNITSTGGATLHATDEVRLYPGFNAILGCQVHIYNDGCSNSFSRTPLPLDSGNFAQIRTSVARKELRNSQKDEIIIPNNYENYFNIQTNNLISNLPIIDKKLIDNIKIFPNPTNGMFTIKFENINNRPLNITIINSTGQLISSHDISFENTILINLKDFPDGIYAVVLSNDKNIFSKLVVKNNQ